MTVATAIFGGTFDPVHYGHLRAAAEVAEALGQVDFRLVPAGTPPHRDTTMALARHRLAMLELALTPWPDLAVDDREVRRRGPSYMVDTLRSLRAENAERPLILCLGQDAANQLEAWYHWGELFELAHLLIMTRPRSRPRYPAMVAEQIHKRRVRTNPALMSAPAGLVRQMEITRLAISSTDIRRQLARGRNPRFLLPESVLAYIHKHGLYRDHQADE